MRRSAAALRGFAAGALLMLGACEFQKAPLVVGSKTFAESRVLGEIFAISAEQAGIPVARRIGLGTTEVNLEAVKQGNISIYPEYNGTGLVMLGQPPISDGEEAFVRVRQLYAPLGLTWGPALGFANDYSLVMLPDRASGLGIESMTDLAAEAGSLTIGVEDDFLTRPLDGFEAMLNRYGMEFGNVEIVPLDDRRDLYDMLLDGGVDVIEVYATDGQLADFNFTVLEDDLGFFPVYEAAPLVRNGALERFPALQGVLDSLEGQLDVALMRRLNNRVELLGEDPADVARSALVDLGLIEGEAPGASQPPLVLAVPPASAADGEAVIALRATRRAFPSRNVEMQAMPDPIGAVDSGAARIAMVGAPAFFEPVPGRAARERGNVEAVGLVGETHVHVLSLDPELRRLEDAETIATGPEGSGSYQAARILMDGLGLSASLETFDAADARGLADAIAGSDADAAVLMQPIGNETIVALLAAGAELVPIAEWDTGNNLLRFPFLRPARIPVDAYPGVARPVETLTAQMVLAGPGPTDERSVGDQGPGASFIPRALPLSPDTVLALAEALPTMAALDPVLPQAAALAPELPSPPASINPAMDISVLSLAVLIMMTWMGWLLFRPERR